MPGPFYFAWVNEGVAFDANVHNVMDEEIFSFAIEHDEGDCPTLFISILNPRVGLLGPLRQQWAYFSYDKNYPNTPDIAPLFYGRVIGVPSDLNAEFVELNFIAKPVDLQEQKEALAATLRVQPYWDPIWFDPNKIDEVDNVLESRGSLWHIDRVTHEVTISNIVSGEDGTLAFGEGDVFHDSVHTEYDEVPLRRVDMLATVQWNQDATDTFNISGAFSFGGFGSIKTFTGEGLLSSWPSGGTGLGGGWEVSYGACDRVDGVAPVTWMAFETFPGQPYQIFGNQGNHGMRPGLDFGEYHFTGFAPEWYVDIRDPLFGNAYSKQVIIPRWRMRPTMIVRYNVSRSYTEVLSMSIEADVQALLTDPGEDEFLQLTMSSAEVASPIDALGALPIGDVRRRTYFAQDRGARSIEYLIAVMRAHLLTRSRAVSVEFGISFADAVEAELSCRKDVALTNRYLPGSPVGGKIKSYRMELDGDSGAATATVVIGCTIGQGNSVEAVPGEPTYVDDGYMNNYQRLENDFVMPIAGEIVYKSVNGTLPNDDGLDLLSLRATNIIASLTKTGAWGDQAIAMGVTAETPTEFFERANTAPTRFQLQMKQLTGGPFTTAYVVETSDLMIPKTINLEYPYE